jgi:hypothetical protein
MFLRYLILLLLYLPGLGQAQTRISTTEFLALSKNAFQIKYDSVKMSQLDKLNFSLPLLKSVELRSETRDMLLERQEYSLRIKPNSLWARSFQKKVYDNKMKAFSLKTQKALNEEIEKRYLLLIDYFFIKKEIALQKAKKTELQDILFVLKQQQDQLNFDIKDYLNAQNDLLENNLRLTQLNQEIASSSLELQKRMGKQENFEINFKDLINPESVLQIKIKDTTFSDHIGLKIKKLKLNTLEKEMKLETCQSRQVLDYVQAKYGGKKSILFKENFSIGIGINLPLFGNTRLKKSKYLFDIINEESELIKLSQKTKQAARAIDKSFAIAKTSYQSFAKQLKSNPIKNLLDNYKKTEAVDPLLLLKLKLMEQKIKIQTNKAQHKMYRLYIRNLSIHETLFKEPYINYLSKNYQMLF